MVNNIFCDKFCGNTSKPYLKDIKPTTLFEEWLLNLNKSEYKF